MPSVLGLPLDELALRCTLVYFGAINVIAFLAFVIDKIRAMRGAWRIRESTLLLLCLVGGAAGGLLGMLVARHKIRKPRFFVGVPAMLVVWLLVAAMVFTPLGGLVRQRVFGETPAASAAGASEASERIEGWWVRPNRSDPETGEVRWVAHAHDGVFEVQTIDGTNDETLPFTEAVFRDDLPEFPNTAAWLYPELGLVYLEDNDMLYAIQSDGTGFLGSSFYIRLNDDPPTWAVE